jgi:hypothetical protein
MPRRRRGSAAIKGTLEQPPSSGERNVMQRRKVDRAQRMRARRIWWERNGAFVRGFLAGGVVTGLGAWILQLVMFR